MSTPSAALALLQAPFRSQDGHRVPVQYAQAVDPDGVVRGMAHWLETLADSIASGPSDLVDDAVTVLRRGSARFSSLALA